MEWESDCDDQRAAAMSVLLSTAAVLLTGERNREVRNPVRRRWWVRPINRRRVSEGSFRLFFQKLKTQDPDWFFKYTRMSAETFDVLLKLVTPHLQKTSIRPHICPEERLALTLRYLADGGSMQSIAFEYRMGAFTASMIIREVSSAIWCTLQPKYLPNPSTETWKRAEEGFARKWNLPNCVGAMDGKHVVMKAPNKTGSMYFNYKKRFSVVLFAVCDADYKFLFVDVGSFGSQSDGGILQHSELGKRMENNTLQFPDPKPLPNSDVLMPHYFVGDEAFPLRIEIMRPYSGHFLEEDKSVFNYRLSRARRCIENAFGILSSRWRIFHQTIYASPETVDEMILATVCLHNFLLENKNDGYLDRNFEDREYGSGDVSAGQWRENLGENSSMNRVSRRLGARNARTNAIEMRDKLKLYLNTAGSVEWQWNHVRRL